MVLLRPLVSVLVLALVVGACSKENSVAVNNDDPCAASDAGAGAIVCDDGCVDVQVSTSHCGACGVQCASGGVCVEGACGCPDGQRDCSGTCVDTMTDSTNCGACGTACTGGQTCQAGSCACPDGGEPCNGVCTSTQDDESNCGSCGNACTAAEECTQGACTCPGDLVPCGGGCVDPLTSREHCGGCDQPCAVSCWDGQCEAVLSVATSASASCAQLEHTTRCWGNLLDGSTDVQVRPLADPAPVRLLSAGRGHFCGDAGGSAWCFGDASAGQLGPAASAFTLTSVMVPLTGILQAVDVGGDWGCAINDSSLIECWGQRTPSPTPSPTPVAVTGYELGGAPHITVGTAHACTLGVALPLGTSTAGSVLCWGSNDSYQLGRDDLTSSATPVLALDAGSLNGAYVASIEAGDFLTYALLSDGSLWSWGETGPVAAPVSGLGAVRSVATASSYTCAVRTDGTVWCWGANLPGGAQAAPTQVAGISNADGVSASQQHVCAWGETGTKVWCWGENGDGQVTGDRGTLVRTPTEVAW